MTFYHTLFIVCSVFSTDYGQKKRNKTEMDPLQQRVLQDDMVQYKIFLLPTTPQQNEQQLKQFLGDILAKFAPLLVDYIWQNQPFNLQYRPSKGKVCYMFFPL